MPMQYRHGDVLVQKVSRLPGNAKKLKHVTLAEGEVTGHSHRIQDKSTAEMYRANDELYLKVTAASAKLIHEEHATIELPRGVYKTWRQREYTPERIVYVRD